MGAMGASATDSIPHFTTGTIRDWIPGSWPQEFASSPCEGRSPSGPLELSWQAGCGFAGTWPAKHKARHSA